MAGQEGAGPAQALRDEPEALPVWLIRKAPAERPVEIREQLRVARQAGLQAPTDRLPRHGRGDGLRQAGRDRLVATKHVVRVDPERPLRHFGGDGWVPVPIPTDPRFPGDERRDVRRPRAGPTGVGGFGALTRDAEAVQRGISVAIEPGDHREHGLIEERERRPDLIERRHRRGPQVGGPPQQRDLLAQTAADIAVLGGSDVSIGQPGEEPVDTAERDEDRPPAGLGRMRGEDRRDPQPVQRHPDVVVGCPGAPQPVDGGGQRVVGPLAGGTGTRAARPAVRRAPATFAIRSPRGPNQLALLGEVDEAEIEAEGADDDFGAARIERLELRDEPRSEPGVVASSEADRRPPDSLDEVEEVAPGLLGDHLAEQRSEESDLGRERVADAARADRGGLGANGLVRWAAGRTHGTSPFRSPPEPSPQSFGQGTAPRLVS